MVLYDSRLAPMAGCCEQSNATSNRLVWARTRTFEAFSDGMDHVFERQVHSHVSCTPDVSEIISSSR